jgi:hypothetical protein
MYFVSFEITFKIIKDFLELFHILLGSWNILTEDSELSAILDYSGMHVSLQVVVTQDFYLDSQWSIWAKTSYLVIISNWIEAF